MVRENMYDDGVLFQGSILIGKIFTTNVNDSDAQINIGEKITEMGKS